jgi:hypothetical protein
MQTAAPEREVKSSGSLASAEFGISLTHAAHIMGILRSTLYSRKVLAILREYSANAWDEHRQCGKGEVPIQVQLPTHFKPTLKIRDFGRGLSEHDVLHLYTQYGESTKRNTNDATGMLGIGCKAGFAYADSFTVTSWHGGTKSTYIAVLDKSNKGEMRKVFEGPCGEETGVEIQVAAKPKDVEEFQREARGLFRYFSPQPVINLPLDTLPRGMTRGFVLDDKGHGWITVMGCIPYRLDLNQLREPLIEANLWHALENISGGIYMPMGSVEFSASREELQYTEVTINALVTQIKALIQEYIDDALASLTQPDVPSWNRRLKATFMHSILQFPLPPAFKPWLESRVPLFSRELGKAPKTFDLVNNNHENFIMVNVTQDARILILEDKSRALKGWHFNHSKDVLAVPKDGFTYEQVKTEIEALIPVAGIDGIVISPMSSRGWWTAPTRANGRRQYPPNQKHKDRTFTLNQRFWDDSPRSQYWTSAKPAEEEHVYCIIREFTPSGITLSDMRQDQTLAEQFNIPWPTIYGYKSTERQPVKAEDIEKGVPYHIWRAKTFGALVTDPVKATLRDLAWNTVFDNMPYRHRSRGEHPFLPREMVAKLSGTLGEKHPVTRYFAQHTEAKHRLSRVTPKWLDQVPKIVQAANYKATREPTREWLDRLHNAYPMLSVCGRDAVSLACVLLDHYTTITDYIRQLDNPWGSTSAPPCVVATTDLDTEESAS